MKLYEIANELRAMTDRLAESGGEITDDSIGESLANLGDAFDRKAEAIIALVREKESLADAIAAEGKRLAENAKVEQAAADRLRKYLMEQMIAAGVPKVKTTIGQAWTQTSGTPSICWAGEGDIPPYFAKTVTTVSLDTTKAREAEKIGTLPGGFIVERKVYLRIK